MARQVGKGFTVHFTASLRAGIIALDELRSQGCLSTTAWFNLHAEAIVNESPYTSVTRILHYTLEDKTRVEVKVMAFAHDHAGENEEQSEGRKWFPCHVFVEKGQRMMAFENHVNLEGYPWTRQPEFDEPLPGAMWRTPTTEEIAALKVAIRKQDEDGFLKIYYGDPIAWKELHGRLGKDTGWVRRTLLKVA